MMTDYRWNQLENARGYDRAAEHVHPYYVEIQDVILHALPLDGEARLVVDLGGGSGRLAERVLERWPRAQVCVLDQSEAFLTLAREKLERFGPRALFLTARIQSDWRTQLPQSPHAIVSMSAIHHLDPEEKRSLYRQCAECLAPGGMLLNGDEVRPVSDAEYLAECRWWAEHMHRVIDAGRIPPALQDALRGWEARNVGQFATPKASGDDCHETAAVQLGYFAAAGLIDAAALWQKRLWAVLAGRRPDDPR